MTPARPLPPEKAEVSKHTVSVPFAIAWSSFFFALLQSVCTFFAAASGLRFVVGLGSVVLSASVGAMMDRFHTDALRVPMIGLALVGSLLNLAILAQVRRLRDRPASRWRQQLPSPRKLRAERLQIVLSIATLVLVAVEESLH
ncbi:MAG TPA: hypothetical protein VE218_09445, partial [Acidobacteriaceae bacterium]|nr:hypothetical protein [Acidobacteriaceae bacterium]